MAWCNPGLSCTHCLTSGCEFVVNWTTGATNCTEVGKLPPDYDEGFLPGSEDFCQQIQVPSYTIYWVLLLLITVFVMVLTIVFRQSLYRCVVRFSTYVSRRLQFRNEPEENLLLQNLKHTIDSRRPQTST